MKFESTSIIRCLSNMALGNKRGFIRTTSDHMRGNCLLLGVLSEPIKDLRSLSLSVESSTFTLLKSIPGGMTYTDMMISVLHLRDLQIEKLVTACGTLGAISMYPRKISRCRRN